MEVTNKTSHILTEMPKRNPTNGTFELTVRCNLHCKMCMFRHDDKENPELMEKELTTEQWIDMARQTAEAGTMSLLITGGEPMLRPDFCEIWEGIYKFGFIITLYTNATLVTPKIMETLQKYPPHKIGVTIYGASSETYEKVCGKAEAFQKAIEGMHQLLSLPSGMEFRTTIIKDNYADALAI
ncbi:MAG: radical SAM protein, partial [Dorea sp.]